MNILPVSAWFIYKLLNSLVITLSLQIQVQTVRTHDTVHPVCISHCLFPVQMMTSDSTVWRLTIHHHLSLELFMA